MTSLSPTLLFISWLTMGWRCTGFSSAIIYFRIGKSFFIIYWRSSESLLTSLTINCRLPSLDSGKIGVCSSSLLRALPGTFLYGLSNSFCWRLLLGVRRPLPMSLFRFSFGRSLTSLWVCGVVDEKIDWEFCEGNDVTADLDLRESMSPLFSLSRSVRFFELLLESLF